METAERGAIEELEHDEDVRKVVAMLENVEFNDTLGMSSHNFDVDEHSHDGHSDDAKDIDSGERTPRAEEEDEWGNRRTYTAKKNGRFRYMHIDDTIFFYIM